MLHKVTLYRAKGKTGPVTLTYLEETVGRSQARFKNRTTLTPQIDLSAYRCAAVVDYIDVLFELSRRTQHWKINDRIERLTGRKEFPEALDLGPGKTASRYKLRVQEPNFSTVRQVLKDIGDTYGFVKPPKVASIEISIDFYPNEPEEEARALLHGVLTRHFFPTTRVLERNRMWPRFTPGYIDPTDYTVGRNESDDSLDLGDRMAPGIDRPALYGSTYYVGEKDDPRALWRIQDKVLDKQNPAAGTRDILTEDQKRIRLEVTLGPEGCEEIGLRLFDDLETLFITRLQKRFFQFMKPVFATVYERGVGPASSLVRQRVENLRRERFLNAGVLGLQIRDDAAVELRRINLPTIRRLAAKRGSRVRPIVRRGTGAYGSMIAYGELTRVVERALTKLQRKIRREMLR